MVDLRAKPFDLNEKELRWVEDTIASMSLDEKLSQLFVLLKPVPGVNEEQIKSLMESARPGGMRWQGGDKETVARQNRHSHFRHPAPRPLRRAQRLCRRPLRCHQCRAPGADAAGLRGQCLP